MICTENAKIVLENGILCDGVISVENDRIAAVGKRSDISILEGTRFVDAEGIYIAPGFANIHNHSANGCL